MNHEYTNHSGADDESCPECTTENLVATLAARVERLEEALESIDHQLDAGQDRDFVRGLIRAALAGEE